MTPSFREILNRLHDNDVEFIIVGGVAGVIQGAPLTTFDLDALVRVTEDNADRLICALDQLGARYREHEAAISPTRSEVLAGGHMLLMTDAGPLDILGFIGDGERYEDLIDQSSNSIAMEAATFNVLSLEELIRQKRITNRPKDRLALSVLEEVMRRRRD